MLVAWVVAAQQHDMRFEHITIENGLSQVCVNDIMQDSDGYLWFATQDGLNRYNGYTFEVFKPNAGDDKSISSNIIKKLFQDRQGVIWVGTSGGGLCRFNKESNSFTAYTNNPFKRSSLSYDDVYSIYEDYLGNLWVGTFAGGLNKFDRKTGTFTHYIVDENNDKSISGKSIRAIIEDKNKRLWVGLDGGGISIYNRETDDFTRVMHDEENNKTLSSDIVISLLCDKDGYVWAGTYGYGLNMINPETFEVTRFRHNPKNAQSISSDIAWSLYENTDNTIWVGTRGGGLSIYDKETRKFTTHNYSNTNKYSVSDDKIISIMRDKSGLVWLGTENNGLNKYDELSRRFELYKNVPDNNNSLSNNNVMCITQQNNTLWVGTRGGGLNAVDMKTGNVTRYTSSYGDANNYNNLLSFDFYKDKIWLGTELDGLFEFDTKKGVVDNYRLEQGSQSISNNAVTTILQSNDSVVWLGTYGGGLNKFDIKKKKFTHYIIDFNLMKNVVLCLYEDRNGILWVGTNGRGLVRFEKKTGRYVYFENDRESTSSISNNVVYAITESRDGSLWIGTGGGGINKFDKLKGMFVAYTQKEGLPNDMILGILEDKAGCLWLSTYNGISKFDPRKREFTNYYENNGLQGNSFNERACFVNKEGKMFFGGPKGVTAFNPESISKNSYQAPVVFTDIKVFNKTVAVGEIINDVLLLTKPIESCDSIELSYRHSVFSLGFASLHFSSPMNNKYRYKMEGFDQEWIYTDASKRFATYTNLPGGEYIFKVQATNSDGVWNEKGNELFVKIVPPFYKTSWFFALLVCVFLLCIYIYVKIREKQLINEKKHLEEMVKERTTEINQQKEELKLQSELLAKSNEDLSRSNVLITDSISYAKRIQEAMLPTDDLFKNHLPQSFIYFRPKDIVSGDFYWFYEHNKRVYVAVADCTGHGVPGAFMSMIGNTLLNEIIIEKEEYIPNEILQKLNTGVIKALNQNLESSSKSQDDGMDISMMCIDYNTNKIELACANHSVFIINNDKVEVVQGDVYSIGGMFINEVNRKFTNHTFDLSKGMQVYMFSDGFQDQFGGPKNKKFLASQFKQFLFDNKNLEMDQHVELLNTTFERWKGRNKQLDDVLVIGIKL